MGDPAEVADDLRLVGRIDQAGGIEQDVGDVARHDAQQHEDRHRHAEQREHHQQQTLHDVGGHQRSSQTSSKRQ
jgi:hypothetical protein